MAFLFQKSLGSTTFVLALLVAVFSPSLFLIASGFSRSAAQFSSPKSFVGCPHVPLIGDKFGKISDTDPLWRNGEACGKQFFVTCTAMVDRGSSPCIENGPSVIVMIAGVCHHCPADILITQEAFVFIAKREITHNLRINLEEVRDT